MSFDGILLNKLSNEFQILKTGRISKINEFSDNDFILIIRANRVNYNLYMSFSSDFARIHLTNKEYKSSSNPKSFTMFLRKHIEGYFIEDIFTHSSDRIIVFKLQGYNELEDLNRKYMICEIMGRYSNLIITDEEYKILEALKHDGVGEFNRTILPNAIYSYPDSNKINPLELTKDEIIDVCKRNNINTPKDYVNTFEGVSLFLASSAFYSFDHPSYFYDLLHIDTIPCIIKGEKKNDFYYHNFNNEIVKSYDSISSLLDNYYYELDMHAKIKLKTNNLDQFINNQINKYEKKIKKLQIELKETEKLDEYRIKGELLLQLPNLHTKANSAIVNDYYNNIEVEIKLDPKYTILDNSKLFYKKYQKLKTSIGHINNQIEIAKGEIDYFNILKYQLVNCTINDALEIQEELINNKYLFKNIKTNNKKNKKQKPKLLTYILDNGSIVSVGKNNLQNEYLTHQLAKSNEYWFHVKDCEGSHVVIHKSGELDECDIRGSAILAAYYSKMRQSSSVAVDYTMVRYIKKIPGKRNCFVTYTNQHTIYIDPTDDFVNSLKIKKG